MKSDTPPPRVGICPNKQRRFSEGHTPLPAEWDKQVELVRKRNFKRWKLQQVIGIKEELDNAYLSAQFPVLQRLQYTKWPPKKLMERVFIYVLF